MYIYIFTILSHGLSYVDLSLFDSTAPSFSSLAAGDAAERCACSPKHCEAGRWD